MGGFIEPNIHPVLVHFTYALGTSAALAYVAGLLVPAGRWRDSLRPAADWMLALAALAVLATIAAGFQAYYSVAHDAPSHEAMTTHRNWAVPTGLALLALAGWRWLRRASSPGPVFAISALAVAGLLTVTAWWGGTIVYKYGLGVQTLPEASGPGHDHDHGGGAGHGDQGTVNSTDDHQDAHGAPPSDTMDGSSASGDGHDHDHTDGAADREMSGTVPAGHDNSDGHHDTKPVSTDEQAILDIMAAIETGWETGDGELFRQNFLDWSVARYFESGGENTGLLDLVENHVEPEKDTIPDLELDFSNIDVQFEGSDFAWAVADTAISGTFSSNGERLERIGKQTVLFRKVAGTWQVIHTHSSSRAPR